MTAHLQAPKGFEARLLHALTEIDAAHLGGALAALGDGRYTVEARTGLALFPA